MFGRHDNATIVTYTGFIYRSVEYLTYRYMTLDGGLQMILDGRRRKKPCLRGFRPQPAQLQRLDRKLKFRFYQVLI